MDLVLSSQDIVHTHSLTLYPSKYFIYYVNPSLSLINLSVSLQLHIHGRTQCSRYHNFVILQCSL